MTIVYFLMKEVFIAFKINGGIFAHKLIYLQIKKRLYILNMKKFDLI